MYSRETELRHLQPNDVYKLGVILDDNNCWKNLMEIIPKELNAQSSSAEGCLDWELATASAGLKYNNDHIRLIESAIKRPGESRLFSQILFEEWGTSGRRHERPTVGVLLQLLVQAELFRAADFVATMLLNESPPTRPLNGPAARIDVSISDDIFNDIEDLVNDSSYYPGTVSLNENANYASSVADNNKDYYTKYQQLEKHVSVTSGTTINDNVAPPKPPPRMLRSARQQQQQQQQQQTTTEVTTIDAINASDQRNFAMQQQHRLESESEGPLDNALTSQNLPKFSILMTRESEKHAFTTTIDNTESTNPSEAPLPMISILAASTINTKNSEIIEGKSTEVRTFSESMAILSMTESEGLPVISALNLNGERDDNFLVTDASSLISSNHHRRSAQSVSSSRTSSLSDESIDDEHLHPPIDRIHHTHEGDGYVEEVADGCDEDYDDNYVPNLSIFEQRSSNNDSSLTTVTGTSGENSFELSMNDCSSASNEDNIPCLSALKQ